MIRLWFPRKQSALRSFGELRLAMESIAATTADCYRAVMQIKSAEFVKSSPSLELCPPPSLPEFAFIGRSNVGKSSLLNSIAGRKGLALVSATPGRTRLINHFRIDDKWFLVDLPGYGYARVAREVATLRARQRRVEDDVLEVRVEDPRVEDRLEHRALGGLRGEVGAKLAVGRDAPGLDARAAGDPLVRRIDELFQVGVGDHALGDVGTHACDGAGAALEAVLGARVDEVAGG